jgi:hypothetical protein
MDEFADDSGATRTAIELQVNNNRALFSKGEAVLHKALCTR